jgi:hypothetical protein
VDVLTLDLFGHNIIHTTSNRRVAIPRRHNTSPMVEPIKNVAEISDNAAPKNKTI